MGRLMTLLMSVLAIVQLIVFSFLSPIYGAVVLIVGLLNLLYMIVLQDSFDNIGLLFEPAKWAIHQTMVAVGASKDFRAAPYL